MTDHRDVLAAAVSRVGGTSRPGQEQMADALAQAFESGDHLLVQAGTGTGKSLGYLAPVLTRVHDHDERVVIATATLALQAQLANNDIPHALKAMAETTGHEPRSAVLKGRSNYACLMRVRDQAGMAQESLLSSEEVASAVDDTDPESVTGAEVVALREWAEDEAERTGLADRDDAPSHTGRGWAQVSVSQRECVGAQRCPYGEECFAERARERARQADVVVTNHALLAIDAMSDVQTLPEYDHVVIDEAHELVARVTGAASAELSPQQVERVAKRCTVYLDDDLGMDFLDAADDLQQALDNAEPGRVTEPGAVTMAFERVRDVSRRVASALGGREGGGDTDNDKRQVLAVVREVFEISERMAALGDFDVVYVNDRERAGREARVAPLSVAGLMRTRVLAEATTVFTSATLKLGGDFTNVAASFGLRAHERVDDSAPRSGNEAGPDGEGDEVGPLPWRGIDVGSPFDYRRQGIMYIAKHLPPPRRDGITAENLTEVAELVWAAGGRTLGLFASQRSAEAAAVHVRRQLPDHTILCQGDAQLSELTRRFIDEPAVSLFGTVSLWQGIDVPGDTCQLVIIDKIPFPRPDDPLMQARQQAVTQVGGNGFMAVAASHAALLLAQGSGRLIRRSTDRGLVAVLDPRLVTARYGSFLRASMPPMWATTERETAIQALRRLTGQD